MPTPEELEYNRAKAKRYRHAHPDRKNARRPIEHMEKQPCVLCQKEGKINKDTEAHHNNYKNPKDVVWLCKTHHELVDTAKDAGKPLPERIRAFLKLAKKQ